MNDQDDHPVSPTQIPAGNNTLELLEQGQRIVDSDDLRRGVPSVTRDEQVTATLSVVGNNGLMNMSSTDDDDDTMNHPNLALSNPEVHGESTTSVEPTLPPSHTDLKSSLVTPALASFPPSFRMTASNDDDDDDDNDYGDTGGNQPSQTPAAQRGTEDDSSLSSSQYQSVATSQQQQQQQQSIEGLNLVNLAPSRPGGGMNDRESVSSMQSAGSYIGPAMNSQQPQRGHAQTRITDTVRFEYNRRVSLVRDMETGRESTRGHRAVRLDPKEAGAGGGIRQRRFLQRRQPSQETQQGGVHSSIRNLRTGVATSQERRFIFPNVSLRGRFVANMMPTMPEDMVECFQDDTSDILANRETTPRQPVQYRLEAFDSRLHGGNFSRALRKRLNSTHEDSVRFEPVQKVYGFRPNMSVVRYLNWTFRTSFFMVSLSACAAYFAITLAFAAAFVVIGHHKPDCIQVAGQPFSSNGAYLDAYALSWTTFSTVGYGAIFPGISTASSDILSCTGITILTTLESFLGILFSSFWAAVFYAKVGRVASFAPAEFSDPMVIRYGVGVMTADDESSDEEMGLRLQGKDGGGEDDGSESHQSGTKNNVPFHFVPSKMPCPLLEFRVVNHRWARLGGEIIEATLNAVASIDERQLSDGVRAAMRGPRRRGKKGRRRLGLRIGGEGTKDETAMPPSRERLEKAQKDVELLITNYRNHLAIKQFPTGRLLPKKIFTKLEIQSYDHPFFKRVWLVRHVLDQYSPLLRPEAKELVRLNGGHWPMELNSAEGVRASVRFDQIVVSLSGISNADANSVYKQKVYDYVDVCVGYQFSDMLFRQHDGSIGVDTRLLNDVKEQKGGGGEDLHAPARKDHFVTDDVLIL